jgi:hypothetical protein
MPRNVAVGLLAAVGSVMCALVGLAHGDLIGLLIADAAAATGLAAYLALPATKKFFFNVSPSVSPLSSVADPRGVRVLSRVGVAHRVATRSALDGFR